MNSRPESTTRLRGQWLFIAHVTWVALTIVTIGLFIAAIPGYVSEISEYAQTSRLTVAPVWDIVLYVGGSVTSIASALLSLILAVLLVWRKPNDRMAVFVSCYLLLFGDILSGALERTVTVWPMREVQASAISKPLLFATPTVALLGLFPSGRFIPRWTRWLTLCSVLLVVAIFYLPPWWWPDTRNPIASITAITWAVILLAALYAQIYRYRRISNSTERQQTKWVVFGFFLWLLLVTVVSGPYAITYGSSPFSSHPWWAPVVRAVWFLSSTILPISLTIAVMRYRLFDIGLLINRTLVYLTLTAIVIGIYVLIVGYLGVLFQSNNNLAISVIATGLVAVVFQPLRQRLQRLVNRLMYGERDEPYAVLTRLGQRLESAIEPAVALSLTVETVARALNLPYVAIALKANSQSQTSNAKRAPQPLALEAGNLKFEIVASHGASSNTLTRLPLMYAGETIGELVAAARAPNETLSPADQRLLSDLARQISLTAHAILLAADLEHARLRIVAAREEARRRLGSDLHDGVGHQLAGLARKAEMANHLLDHDPTAARAMLGEVTEQLNATILQVRGLAHQLHPPELELLGLIGALRERAQMHTGLAIRIDAPETLPPLSTAVETAAYYIALEALTNVEKHAAATSCQIRLGATHHDSMLELDIADDGRGLPPEKADGLGLLSMQARAAEVGGICRIESTHQGGTRVSVRLPCPAQLE